jgi:hypothetical protein
MPKGICFRADISGYFDAGLILLRSSARMLLQRVTITNFKVSLVYAFLLGSSASWPLHY